MKKLLLNFFFLLLLIIPSHSSCKKDNDNKISGIDEDIDLYDDKTYTINSDIDDITGSISLGSSTVLIIEDATLNFDLEEDLQYGIYL